MGVYLLSASQIPNSGNVWPELVNNAALLTYNSLA